MRRFAALLLALIMVLSLCPVTVWAETLLGAPIYEVTGSYVAEDDGISSDELFAAYFQQELDESLGIETPNAYRSSALKDGTLEREIYDTLKVELAKIAAGTETSTVITIYPDGVWSLADLGVTAFFEGGNFSAETESAIGEKLELIYDCLVADCPLELYWHDKTIGVGMGYKGSSSGEDLMLPTVTFAFSVAMDYNDKNDAELLTTDASITSATSTAIANAKIIVENNADKSDMEKLAAYKDVICERVSYNDAAADAGSSYEGINPWQMIYVFDGNPATNVVCEGYAKAFQYLCDLTAFDGDIECHTVHGYMDGEAHMWNVVTMDDGKNYLVDVTNCDSGAIGADDKLFMAYTATAANSNQSHTFTIDGTDVEYTYDTSMAGLFCNGYLPISTSVYEKPTLSASATLTGGSFIQAGSDVTLTLTVSGSNISGIHAALHYDSEVFEFVGTESLLTGWSFEQNEGVYTLHHATDAFNEAEVLQVTLRVKERTAAGTALNASFNNITVSDGNAEADISPTSWSGTVATSPQARWGLANGTDAPTTWVGSGTLSQAMSYANGLFYSTAYIQLRRDVNTSYVFAINNNKTAILDLNGYDITRTVPSPIAGGNVITVQGTLTLCDTYSSDVSEQGTVTGGNSNSYAGGIWVESGAVFNMRGGNIAGNSARGNGGGVYNAGTFTMTSGSIAENTANNDYGGGVFMGAGAIFEMSGGSISDNSARYGGGIYVQYNSHFTMSGNSLISDNTAKTHGGGIYSDCSGNGTVTMTGGTISNNTATNNGGGVFVNGGKFIMNGGAISENHAEDFGGGVYNYSYFTMRGNSSISGNTADAGAGIYLPTVGVPSSFQTVIEGGTISGNTALLRGGGINVAGCTLTVKSGSIKDNVAPVGAGVNVERSNSIIKLSANPVISGNKTDTTAAAQDSNLYLLDGYKLIVGSLGSNANVGITMKNLGIFAEPDGSVTTLSGYINRFTSDNAAYTVAADGNNLKLIERTGVTVSGTVTSFLSSADAENDVTIELWAEGATTATYATTASGNSAEYIFEGVEAGIYTMRVSKANHVTREYDVTVDSEAVELDVKIHLKGDVNGDGETSIKDWNDVYKHINKTALLADYVLYCADIDCNNHIEIKDWNSIYKHIDKTVPLW